MAEDTQQAEIPVTEPQDSPMPSENEQAAPETEKEGLPEDAKERTKKVVDEALSKAKTYEQQLKEERTRREYYEQLFQQMRSQEEQPKFVDPVTGLPNEEALANLSKQTQEAALRAGEAEKKVLEYQRDQENRSVYAAHPELNPDAKEFNKDLHNLTRSFLLDSMVNPDAYEGKNLSFMDAAERAKKILGGNIEEAKKLGAQEAIEQLTPKEQASLDAVGSPSRRTQLDNLEDLRRRSRGRDDSAREARIKRFNRILGRE